MSGNNRLGSVTDAVGPPGATWDLESTALYDNAGQRIDEKVGSGDIE